MRIYDPNRKEYHKRMSTQKRCDFCDRKVIRKQNCASLEGEYWYVLAASYPYLNGNVLIIPKRHVEKVEDLRPEEWKDWQETLLKAKKCLGKLFKTQSFNVGINLGKDSGASIKHLHWQLIPRTKKQVFTVLNLLADLHLISLSGNDLKVLIEKGAVDKV